MSQDVPSDHDPAAQPTDAGGREVDWGLQFEPGSVLGDRYQIRALLGCGGRGEVWHAYDLKLRVEVALKGLRPELLADGSRRESLRPEVRAAREVVSPNVCRIFDLIEADGSELVSMEYVDGGTLLEVLQERGPLDLKEAQDIASQFLAGLEAIHKAGLVHRDVKPENIMLTRAGRVVLMDFGLARQEDSGASTVSGTPAYMAPEQAMGGKVDARADVYSAGVVLAEMVSPDGIKNLQSRQSVWEGIRHEPARVPDSPWAPVLEKAVAKEPDNRYNSAHTLIRALEDVTLREKDADEVTPYPGLAFFTEADADYFYGREAEVERMWRTLEQPYLFAIIGPSGAGKSSFLRAGLIPARPQGWSFVVATPGSSPFVQLVQALVPELSGDTEAIQELVRTDDSDAVVSAVGRWRAQHDQAVLVVDQFEELFTLNSPEVQTRFADLLARFALEADVHVLLSMRDDFLFHCQAFEALKPVFAEITPLGPPVGGALRRALVQPASKCGYRFEDDDLVEEMLAEVEGERGLLPLLAFAVNRLWEERDSEAGLLTREAYERIGGVGGALARHAEETLEQIGEERAPMVRELFRNLMTAQGTRAVRDLEELLSVFESGDRESAAEVLRELVDARLLTTFEVEAEDEETRHRVEIIHESLLSSWPRLVGWRTQDADAVRLRDEVRQAARTWDEHERPDDLLWSGTAYREFASWRERYQGGLSETEESFARAMIAHVKRRRRRRRVAVAAVIAFLVAGLAVVGSFWQRSLREAERAEAANLVSLGQLELGSYPSATVAYSIASLEMADGPGARRLALEALWKGPTALVATEDFAWGAQFSPDGRWLVQAEYLYGDRDEGHLSIIGADGSSKYLENAHSEAPTVILSAITGTGHFVSYGSGADSTWEHILWSVPERRRIAEVRYKEPAYTLGIAGDANRNRHVLLVLENDRAVVDALGYDGSVERIGSVEFQYPTAGNWRGHAALDPRGGHRLAAVVKNDVLVFEIGDQRLSEPRRLGRVNHVVADVQVDPLGRFIATADADGEIRLWSLTEAAPPVVLQGPPEIRRLRITTDGSLLEAAVQEEGNWISWVWDLSGSSPRFLRRFNLGKTGLGGWRWDTVGRQVARWGPDLKIRVWSMDAPADAEPLILNRGDNQQMNEISFNPRGSWLATGDLAGRALWPFAREYPIVIRRHEMFLGGLVFGPDGSWLASSSADTVRLWPLYGKPPPLGRTLLELESSVGLAASPDGERILASTNRGGTWILRPGGGEASKLEGFTNQTWAVAFSADGRLAAAAGGQFVPAERVIRIWDIDSREEVDVLEVGEKPYVYTLHFTPDGHLLSASESGLLRWDVETGERELLYEGNIFFFAASANGHQVLMVESEDPSDLWGRVLLLDLDSDIVTHLGKFGDEVSSVAFNPAGTIAVTGDRDGEIRVGPLTGEEPHLFLGHESTVWALAVDPRGRWIASGGQDTTVRLWPMPDLSKPPLHTLPREELIAKLKTLTNLRVVRDEDSPTGWKLEVGPFPGWETVPTW